MTKRWMAAKDTIFRSFLRGACLAAALPAAACGGSAEGPEPPSSESTVGKGNDSEASGFRTRRRPDAPEARGKKRVRSWLETLPQLAPAEPPPGTLAPGAAGALATCDGGGVLIAEWMTAAMPSTTVAHTGGRWYFEATMEQYEPGWTSVGVFAPPTEIHYLVASHLSETNAAAGFRPTGLTTVSVAADLDAAMVYFFENGVLVEERALALVPGVGAFRAGGVAMSGTRLRINLGSEPFAYGVPPGYGPWFSGDEDASGACVSDAGWPARPAPVTVDCGGEDECFPTSFLADTRAPVDLVVLGVYDAGSESGWTWGIDPNGNVTRVPTGQQRNGSAVVQVNRPGRIALVLSAYEPTDWTVNIGPSTQLSSVSAYGYYRPSVSGVAAGVPIDIHSVCSGAGRTCDVPTGEVVPGYAYQWPFSSGGSDTQGFVKHVEAQLGLPLKIFAGAYEARGFTVE